MSDRELNIPPEQTENSSSTEPDSSQEIVNQDFEDEVSDTESQSSPERPDHLITNLDDVDLRSLYDISKFDKIDPALHREIALKLIEAGQGEYIAENLKEFLGLDHKEIVLKMIESGGSKFVARNLEKFQGLDHKEIALKMIEAGGSYYIVENLEKFQGLDHKEIALKLIEIGKGRSVAKNLEKFQGLDSEVALKLVEVGNGGYVAKNLEKFQGLDKEVALKLIEAGQGGFVARNLEKFQGLDHKEIALKLIEARYEESVLVNLEKFHEPAHKEIALKLIEINMGYYIAVNLEKFQGLDKEVALKLIEVGRGGYVAENLEKFHESDHKEIALKLIEIGKGRSVAKNLEKFQGLDKEVGLKLIEVGLEDFVAGNLEKSQELDREIALKLIEVGYGGAVTENLEKFHESDHKEIALKLIEADMGYHVTENLEKFQGLNYQEIALKLIEAGLGRFVVENLEKFHESDHKEIALKIIESGQAGSFAIINNLEKFQELELDKEIAFKLIEAHQGEFVAVNLEKFQGLDHKETALKLIEVGKGSFVAKFLDNFEHWQDYADQMVVGFLRVNEWPELDHDDDIANYYSELNPYQQQILDTWSITTVDQYFDFYEEEKPFVYYLSSHELAFSKEDLPHIRKLHLHLLEAQELAEQGVDFKVLADNKSYIEVYEKIKAYEVWDDEQNVRQPFERGSEVFDIDKMFAYLDRQGLSRHDGLHAFDRVIELQQESGLSPDQFYNNILQQVNADGSDYESGTAHHELNSISQSLNLEIKEVLAKAEKHQTIDKLQDLSRTFKEPKDVFASWASLKRYFELSRLLEQAQILEELSELKKSGQDKLYKFVETLAFHPSSKVDMSAVINFWRQPEEFLSEYDSHTPEEIQDRKKPSNYIEIPHLDLTAEELRDALVNGDMDKLQVFTPMEISYKLPKSEELSASTVVDRLKTALGSRSAGVEGKAKNPKKLFSEINKALKALPQKVSLMDVLNNNVPDQIQAEVENIIEEKLDDKEIGLPEKDTLEIVASIYPKSSPEGVLAGNDTACCMPFGAGKNTVYMFNPDTAQFTVQVVKANGERRTIAQSVLTKDKDVKKAIPDILDEMTRSDLPDIKDILPEDVLLDSENYLSCDNVEIAPNFQTGEYSKVIEQVYRDFFTEYLKRFAEEQNLNPDKVPIGMGYSDSLNHLPKVDNTFVPLAPVGYSDKTAESVYLLNLSEHQARLKKKVKASKAKNQPDQPAFSIKGVDFLTFEDTLPVAFLESKAYEENQSLIQYLHNMENGLIAKDINNAAKGRPNMSLKYTDKKGRVRGYLLAYEGMKDSHYQDDYLEEDYYEEDYYGASQEKIIYVSDLAADPQSIRAGGSLIKEFIALYQKNYLDKDNPLPIYAETREKTSYAIVKKQLKQIADPLGVEHTIEEMEPYQQGEDTMHPVMIRPVVKKDT